MYKIAVLDCKDKFKEWIDKRGGITIWKNINLSNPGAGEMFTPALTTEGKEYPKPSFTVSFHETVKDLSKFIFVKEIKEVKRIKVAIRKSSNGLILKLTTPSTNKLQKALAKYGDNSRYHFDYDRQEAVISIAIWE